MSLITDQELKTIITDPNGAQVLVKNAEKIGADLVDKKLSTGQIRALFGEVRQIEAQWDTATDQNLKPRQDAVRRLYLLKPKMAYRAKRESSKAVEELVSILEPALDLVLTEKDPKKQDDLFKRFVEFFEAILAYHRAKGGK